MPAGEGRPMPAQQQPAGLQAARQAPVLPTAAKAGPEVAHGGSKGGDGGRSAGGSAVRRRGVRFEQPGTMNHSD
jgi:hypothetical protein